MFIVTLIITIYILFFSPINKYLGVYNDKMIIYYDFDNVDGYEWSYTLNNDNIILSDFQNSKWVFKPNKNGSVKLIFKYINNDNDTLYVITYDLKVRGNKIIWLNGEGVGLVNFPNPM